MENITKFTDMTPDEFAEKFAPANVYSDGQENYCILNRETCKLELHFTKDAYDHLSADQKARIKSNFLWGRRSGCWISRAKEPNLYYARKVAEEIGLTDAGATGERLTFAEQQERKAERAERRANRFEIKAEAARQRGEELQKPISDMHGDIAFFTQPNINTSAGRAFTRQRERMFDAFDRGVKEFNKSEYFRERAKTARTAADQPGMKDRAFIQRRIDETEADIRALRRHIESASNNDTGEVPEQLRPQVEIWLDRMEQQLDKLGYYQDALEALGGITYSQENVKPGYRVKVQRWGDGEVVSAGPKNFRLAVGFGSVLTCSYAEIISIVRAESKIPEQHPFQVGETFELRDHTTHTIIKVTPKTVTIQSSREGEKPYRVTPRYRSAEWHNGEWNWALPVGGNSWASTIYYRV